MERGWQKPNGPARSSSYSSVARGCSVETKARVKAVVTDGIPGATQEPPGSTYISRKLSREWWWEDVTSLHRRALLSL